MEEYESYATQALEEAPLYLFERDLETNMASAKLDEDYSVPSFFCPIRATMTQGSQGAPVGKSAESSKEIVYSTDLFRLLGDARPDFRWLVVGPKRSGSIFHIDPNGTNAWNVVVTGRKKWIFYPPHRPPPGVVSSADGSDVVVPLSVGEVIGLIGLCLIYLLPSPLLFKIDHNWTKPLILFVFTSIIKSPNLTFQLSILNSQFSLRSSLSSGCLHSGKTTCKREEIQICHGGPWSAF
jgi:hypothetical protein